MNISSTLLEILEYVLIGMAGLFSFAIVQVKKLFDFKLSYLERRVNKMEGKNEEILKTLSSLEKNMVKVVTYTTLLCKKQYNGKLKEELEKVKNEI